MARQPTGRQVMSTQGQMPAQQPQEQAPRGRRDFFDRLAIGLEGMTLNPNQALIQGAQGRINARREDRQTSQQRNKTADWLESQGMTEYANGVRSGAISGRDAIALAQQAQQGPDQTAAMQNYQYLVSQGVDPSEAMERAFGKGGTSVSVMGQAPKPDTGYRNVYDDQGRLVSQEPIPGGPVDREIQEQRAAEQQRLETSQTTQSNKESVVVRDIDRMVEMIDSGGIFDLPESGIWGSRLANIAGGLNQEAVTFKNLLDGIQSNVAFDRLQQMREASKTGGALGAVSERELGLLMSALGTIDQSTSPQILKENLEFIKRTVKKIENDPIASKFFYDENGSSGAASAGSGFSVTGRID